MSRDLISAARRLVESVEFDVVGTNGKGGHGGLTSDKTLRAAGELRVVIDRSETAIALSHENHEWRPPAESERPEGYRCLALVELEWMKILSGAFGWHRPDEHAFLEISEGAPGVHGFRHLGAATSSAKGEKL